MRSFNRTALVGITVVPQLTPYKYVSREERIRRQMIALAEDGGVQEPKNLVAQILPGGKQYLTHALIGACRYYKNYLLNWQSSFFFTPHSEVCNKASLKLMSTSHIHNVLPYAEKVNKLLYALAKCLMV